MGNRLFEFLYVAIVASFLFLALGECKKKKNSLKKPNNNETTLFNFLRLVVYRLIYGFATMFGGQEAISDFMGGIFVPPGADDYGDGDGGGDEDGDGDYRDYLDEFRGDGDYY